MTLERHRPDAADDLAPIDDPGLGEHTWRPTDVDEAKERRAERQVAALFVFSMLCTVLFAVSYFTLDIGENWTTFAGLGASTLALGVTLGGALISIGVGIIHWARKLMADKEISELRHPAASSPEDITATLQALDDGLQESGIGRRPLIRNTMIGAIALLGLPAIVALRDLGPLPGNKLFSTIWAKDMMLARDPTGTPIRPSDLEIGDLVNGQPIIMFETDEEGEPLVEGHDILINKAKASIVVVKIDPADITPMPGRENWSVDGIVCYSKICTHVGCPINLYEKKTHHLLCPCHQSTFDLADGAKVVFGPAARPLPQLPLSLDESGYLVAQSDFTEPVGPSFWERG